MQRVSRIVALGVGKDPGVAVGSIPCIAGYSSTPTAKKLGIKADSSLLLVNPPAGWVRPSLPPGVEVTERPALGRGDPEAQVVVAFVRSAAEVQAGLTAWAPTVWPDRLLWVAWPRRAGGHDSDVTDQVIRAAALPLGLVDTKVAAIDDDWSGLRLVWRVERRRGPRPTPSPTS